MSDLRRRIESLEAGLPREIILTLKDGGTFHHSGPAARFFFEASQQINEGSGELRDALRDSVKGQGCGLLRQLLRAMLLSVENLKETENANG